MRSLDDAGDLPPQAMAMGAWRLRLLQCRITERSSRRRRIYDTLMASTYLMSDGEMTAAGARARAVWVCDEAHVSAHSCLCALLVETATCTSLRSPPTSSGERPGQSSIEHRLSIMRSGVVTYHFSLHCLRGIQ